MKRTTNKPFTILTNDPSFTAWGWAVLSLKGAVLETGCIKTAPSHKKLRIRKGDDRTRRISEINHVLLGLIEKHNIRYILAEQPHGSQNASAAVMIGICLGIMQTLSDVLKIGVEWYGEEDAKKCVLHKKSATKAEMISAIGELYKIRWTWIKYKDEAVADALAIHYVATQQSNTLKFLKRGDIHSFIYNEIKDN